MLSTSFIKFNCKKLLAKNNSFTKIKFTYTIFLHQLPDVWFHHKFWRYSHVFCQNYMKRWWRFMPRRPHLSAILHSTHRKSVLFLTFSFTWILYVDDRKNCFNQSLTTFGRASIYIFIYHISYVTYTFIFLHNQ